MFGVKWLGAPATRLKTPVFPGPALVTAARQAEKCSDNSVQIYTRISRVIHLESSSDRRDNDCRGRSPPKIHSTAHATNHVPENRQSPLQQRHRQRIRPRRRSLPRRRQGQATRRRRSRTQGPPRRDPPQAPHASSPARPTARPPIRPTPRSSMPPPGGPSSSSAPCSTNWASGTILDQHLGTGQRRPVRRPRLRARRQPAHRPGQRAWPRRLARDRLRLRPQGPTLHPPLAPTPTGPRPSPPARRLVSHPRPAPRRPRTEIEVALYHRLRDLFSLKPDLVLYDITSTYFEGPARTISPSTATAATASRRTCR